MIPDIIQKINAAKEGLMGHKNEQNAFKV